MERWNNETGTFVPVKMSGAIKVLITTMAIIAILLGYLWLNQDRNYSIWFCYPSRVGAFMHGGRLCDPSDTTDVVPASESSGHDANGVPCTLIGNEWYYVAGSADDPQPCALATEVTQ